MIRIAESTDFEQLAGLFKELHLHHVRIKPEAFVMPADEFFENKIREILNGGEQSVFVSDNSGLDGYAVVKIIDVDSEDKPFRRVCFIDCFAVAKRARRKGIGTALFEAVNAFARENGCTSVQLGVSACNGGAIGFYKKMGLLPRTITMERVVGASPDPGSIKGNV